jgi:hypothetical protein
LYLSKGQEKHFQNLFLVVVLVDPPSIILQDVGPSKLSILELSPGACLSSCCMQPSQGMYYLLLSYIALQPFSIPINNILFASRFLCFSLLLPDIVRIFSIPGKTTLLHEFRESFLLLGYIILIICLILRPPDPPFTPHIS